MSQLIQKIFSFDLISNVKIFAKMCLYACCTRRYTDTVIRKFNFEQLDDALRNGSILPYEVFRGCLRMDGQTMANLEIFSNSEDGGTSGKWIL